MSLVWQAWITEPEHMNSRLLKNACVIRWNMPATQPPTPKASIM